MARSRFIENTPLTVFLTVLAVVALTTAAHGGIVDSPVPNLGGTTKILFTVPGVINNNGLSTYFSCTSTEPSAAQTVAVEVFDHTSGAPLNNALTTDLAVSSGVTVTFGTQLAAGLIIDQGLGNPTITRGSARILSTSAKLICSAFVSGNSTGPPVSMTNLSVITKLKQTGN